jgi:negative regulator of flagellin synthesis FlgM
MQIQGLQSSQAIQSLNATQRGKALPATDAASSGSATSIDQLDLSAEAQSLSHSASIIRQDKVDAIRQAIANGSYESPEKLSAALDKLLDTFA